ncbi:hypothetical protein BH11PSE4_BH11PSE4_12430 [soil metagenome]
MNGYQLFGLFAPAIGAASALVFMAIGLYYSRAAYRRAQAEALPPHIQEAARAANEKFIADALKDLANRPAA